MQVSAVQHWLIVSLLTTTVICVWTRRSSLNRQPQLQKIQRSRNQVPTSYVMGTWSPWSQWTPCSRTCGRGVSIQTRDCASDQQQQQQQQQHQTAFNRIDTLYRSDVMFNSKASSTCVGQYKRYQFCNAKGCSGRKRDYRYEQCSNYNRKLFMGRYYQWEPFWQGSKQCELNCRPKRERFYVTLAQSVIDGTPCTKNSKDDVCIGGICKHVGCDGIIGSDKSWDHCGICGGDNSTCRIVSGLYTMPQLPYGYNLVATIPKGACNVNISELKPSRNYLALRYLNGSYILNGNWAINWSGSYDAVGTVFEYQRDDDSPFSLEYLTAKGPTNDSVDMMVLSQHTNPGIKYEYTLPLRDAPSEWMPLPHPPLTVSSEGNGSSRDLSGFGRGRAAAKIIPVERAQHGRRHHKRRNHRKKTHNNNNGVAVQDDTVALGDTTAGVNTLQRSWPATVPNNALSPFEGNFSTNGDFGLFVWRVSGFSECSRSCGGGIQKNIVVCVKEQSLAVVDDHNCNLLNRPDSQSLLCNARPCPPEWVTTEWSDCTVTCGDGMQSREMSCKQTVSAAVQISVADKMCATAQPEVLVRKCNSGPCYRWKAGDWGQCSVHCGKGVKRREVRCLSAAGKSVSSTFCDSSKKLVSEEGCDMGSCSNMWFFSEWSQQCLAECGTGTHTRKIYCSSETGGNSKHLCDPNAIPEQARSCTSEKSCQQGKWFTGPWHQCSSSCGPGIQRRDVVCLSPLRGQYKVAADALCVAHDKPSSEQRCDVTACKPEWYMSDWTQCSQSCDSGVQVREVKCLNENQKPSTECDETKHPPSRQNCNTAKCSQESQGDSVCVDKYHNCHLVVQSRLCRYNYYRNMCCDSCYSKHR